MIEFKTSIIKFNSNRYLMWKEKLQLIFHSKDLGDTLNSTVKVESKPLAKAHFIVKLALGDQQFNEICGETTVHGVLSVLDKHLLSDIVAALWKCLFTLKIEESQTICTNSLLRRM